MKSFGVISKLGKKITVSAGRWFLISNYKHPSMRGKERDVQEVLSEPDEVRVSKTDSAVFLYHKFYGKYAITVVTRHLNSDGFMVTAYTTTSIKEGKVVWKR